jgi:hypothetical protein
LFIAPVEPVEIDWPYARTLLCVESWRGTKLNPGKPERRYYISSLEPSERTPTAWGQLIRSHWAGVEVRNHWRKDACWGEDRTRSRNPNIVGALALLRNALLALIADQTDIYGSMPAFFEACHSNPSIALTLIHSTL